MIYFEDFTSYPAGVLTTNTQWEEKVKPTTGMSLAIINNLANSPSGKALVLQASSSTGSRVYAYKPLNGVTNLETLVLFSAVPTGDLSGRQGGLYNRYSGTDEASTKGYVVNFTPNDTSTRAIWLVDDSSPEALGKKPFAWTNTTRYWHRLSTFGNQIKSKTWEYGTTEPTAWDFEVTDNNVTTGNYNGVGTYATGTVSIMQYSANTEGTAPMVRPSVPTSAPTGVIGGGIGTSVSPMIGTATNDYFLKRSANYSSSFVLKRVVKQNYSSKYNISKDYTIGYDGKFTLKKISTNTYVSSFLIEPEGSITYNASYSLNGINNDSYSSNYSLHKTVDINYSSNYNLVQVKNDSYNGSYFLHLQTNQPYNSKYNLWRDNNKNYSSSFLLVDNPVISRSIGIAYTDEDYIYGSLYNKRLTGNTYSYGRINTKAFGYVKIDEGAKGGNI